MEVKLGKGLEDIGEFEKIRFFKSLSLSEYWQLHERVVSYRDVWNKNLGYAGKKNDTSLVSMRRSVYGVSV